MKTLKAITITILISLPFFASCDDNPPLPASCSLTPNPGPCMAAIPKYYFNPETGQCEEFIWGGCGGTVPFDTMEECEICECQ